MRSDLLPGTSNVFRFPVERQAKPTLDLLYDIAPDVRIVLNNAEAFGLVPPNPALRDSTDAATADYIALQIPKSSPERATMLQELEDRVLGHAIDAIHAASDAATDAQIAQAALDAAKNSASRHWLEGLAARADAEAERATILLLHAHECAEEAFGVMRAVSLARRYEAWFPRNPADETDALIAIGAGRR